MRALVPLLIASFAAAQEPDAPAGPFGHSRHGVEFDEGPRQAAFAMPGMNANVHFPVHGLSEQAQAYFDQGVVQLHGFWYFEAERSFRQVATMHADCAMAHWGMALANIENEPRAAQCIANAVRCSAGAPPREQRWVDAWASFHGVDDAARTELRSGDAARVQKQKDALAAANKDRKKDAKESAYRKLLKDLGTLVHEDPTDVEAKAFLAIYIWHAYDWGSGIPIPSHTAVDALLDPVLAAVPLHPAHHYRVHLWDREQADRALRSAAALGDSAPGIAHQWHMAGHIYAQLDRHAEAAWQQEASARVDHAHMQRDRVMPFLIHNYAHNQEWWARSLSYVASGKRALAVAKNLAEIPRHPLHNTVDGDKHIAAYARRRLVSVCEDHEMWQDAVDLVASGHLDMTESVQGEVLRLGLLGRAYFRLGRLDDARAIVAATDPLLAKARAARAAAVDQAEDDAFAQKQDKKKVREAMGDAGREPSDSVQAVLDLRRELKGEELLASGDPKGALAEFEAVKGFPKTLLADAMVVAGERAKAIELLEREDKENPNRVPILARLFIALCAAHDAGELENKDRMRDLMGSLGVSERMRDLTPLERRTEIGVDCVRGYTASETSGFGDDFGERPPVKSLGPEKWHPFGHAGFDLPQHDGARTVLADRPGKPTLVVYYLGFECLQCVSALQALRAEHTAFAAAGVDVIAIGDQDPAALRAALDALPADEKLPFTMLADPEHVAFKAWRCFDDFEQMPLHGAFLIDAQGYVRWQDVSATPFTQFAWLLGESRRLLALQQRAPAR